MTEEKLFEARIIYQREHLDIELTYESKCTGQDNKMMELLYQLTGEKADITELIHITTSFRMTPGKEICPRVEEVHEEAPYVLPRLIQELKSYNTNDSKESELVKYTVGELEKIINSK